MIKRRIADGLLDTIHHFPVTGIVGPRQVGKTTLSQLIRKSLDNESVYIDLENPRDLIKLSDPNLFFEANADKCVILDEIQLLPDLFPVMRSMVDLHRVPARFIILGSASPSLIRQSSESLAGRIAYLELTGFNLTELPKNSLNKHWIRGGFPDAFLAPDDKIWRQWLDNFIKTYVERDLPMLGLNISAKTMRMLWGMIAHSHGNVINYSNLGRSLELSSTTIKKYLDFLENAFLIRQLQPFHKNLKKRLVKSPKIYVRDSGILHHLLNIESRDDLESHPMKGNSWEGYVVEQILQLANTSYQPYFYRTHQGAECDLVLAKSSKPICAIEIKYASAPRLTKGNAIAFADLDAMQNYIITPNTDDFLIGEKTRVCSLQLFLEKYI